VQQALFRAKPRLRGEGAEGDSRDSGRDHRGQISRLQFDVPPAIRLAAEIEPFDVKAFHELHEWTALRLLCAGRQRPYGKCRPEEGEEVAPFHVPLHNCFSW
jgi:hypothetical protein